MRMSSLQVGHAGRIIDEGFLRIRCLPDRFVVVDRCPEDRSSGVTDVVFEGTGIRVEFAWDRDDPEVEKLGRGRVETRVVIE